MAQTLDDRIAVPQWSDPADFFPDQAEWSAFFDAINDSAALDAQGLRAARPAAAPANRGLYHFATDGVGGAAKALSRSDGAAWHELALLGARADFTAGATVTDGAPQLTAGYGTLGVTRAAAGAHLAFGRTGSANRPAFGVDAADALMFGMASAAGAIPAPLATISTTGVLKAVGDAELGANVFGAAGSKLRAGSFGDASNAYVSAEGSGATGLVLRAAGVASTIRLQPDASTTVLTASPTALTLAKATTITAGGLNIAAGGLTVTGLTQVGQLNASSDVYAQVATINQVRTGIVGGGLGAGIEFGSSANFMANVSSNDVALYTGGAVKARFNASASSVYGILTAATVATSGGGIDVKGSMSGYHGELRFSNDLGNGTIHAITTLVNGNSTLYFDHRGTANQGGWVFRNGTAGTLTRFQIDGTGVVQAVGSNHYFGVYAFGAAGSRARLVSGGGNDVYLQAEASSGDANLFLKWTGNGAAYFQRGDGTSLWWITNAGDLISQGSTFAVQLQASQGRLSAKGDQNGVIGFDSAGNTRYLFGLRSDVAGNTTDLVAYIYGGAIRFYPQATQTGAFTTWAGAFTTALWLYWGDNGGGAHFSRVMAVHSSTLDGVVGPNGHILYVTY